jgi:hypothetical protein
MKTSVSSPWLPVAFAGIVLLGFHGWYVAFLIQAQFSFQHALAVQDAVVASLRQLPQTVAWLLPAWLPFIVPAAYPRLKRWVTVACAAVASGLALSLFVVVAWRQELFFFALGSVYGVVGFLYVLQLAYPLRCSKARRAHGA